jgi:hypothetical protein
VRGYKLSFFLAGALIVAAFLTNVYDKRTFGKIRGNTGSWFLLIGGLLLLVYGYFEYRKIKK